MSTQNATPSFLDLVLGPWLNGSADFLQDNERILMQTLAEEEVALAVCWTLRVGF